MNTFTTAAIGALFLAAALTTLTTLLWPDSVLGLGICAFVAIFLNGVLAVRLQGSPAAARPARKPQKHDTGRKPAKAAAKPAQPAEPAAPVNDADLESGTVKWFNRSKGFGFIIRESGEEIFVHQRSINRVGQGGDRHRPTLKDGQKVRFTVADHEKGLQAENVSAA